MVFFLSLDAFSGFCSSLLGSSVGPDTFLGSFDLGDADSFLGLSDLGGAFLDYETFLAFLLHLL